MLVGEAFIVAALIVTRLLGGFSPTAASSAKSIPRADGKTE